MRTSSGTAVWKLVSRVVALLPFLLFAALAQADVIGDPAGDTFAPGPDITSVSTTLSGVNQSTLQIGVNFAGPIFAPSTFHLHSLGGYILLDTNGNANMPAALASLLTQLPPVPGVDFYIDLFSEESQPPQAQPRLVSVVNAAQNSVGAVPITYFPTSFVVDVPVSLLGTQNPSVGLIVGTFDNRTDVARLVPSQIAPIPEPGSLALFMVVAGAAAGAWHIRPRNLRRA